MVGKGMTNICFDCKNSVPDDRGHGCPWSRKFEPVEGWTAKKVKQCIGNGKYDETYHITACPMFDRDRPAQRSHGRVRPVRCKETGVVYETILDAARCIGISPSTISVCLGRSSHYAGGYHWEEVQEAIV